jgi:alanine racemase
MNRLGFRHDNLKRTLPELLASKNLVIDAVHTHFGTADEPWQQAVRDAAHAIRVGVPHARRAGRRPPPSSRRQFRGLAARFARVVRLRAPGLLLYGLVPPPLASTIELKPVMSLTSRVVAVKGVRVGEGRRIWRSIHRRAPRDLSCHSRGLR